MQQQPLAVEATAMGGALVVAGGSSYGDGGPRAVTTVAALDAAGRVDGTYNAGQLVRLALLDAVARMAPSGELVIAGTGPAGQPRRAHVVVLTPTGAVDGRLGAAVTTLPAPAQRVRQAVLTPEGDLVVLAQDGPPEGVGRPLTYRVRAASGGPPQLTVRSPVEDKLDPVALDDAGRLILLDPRAEALKVYAPDGTVDPALSGQRVPLTAEGREVGSTSILARGGQVVAVERLGTDDPTALRYRLHRVHASGPASARDVAFPVGGGIAYGGRQSPKTQSTSAKALISKRASYARTARCCSPEAWTSSTRPEKPPEPSTI